MTKPTGRCAFCGGKRLTKGHIWPASFGKILPSDAKYYEQRIGTFNTFTSTIPGPKEWARVGTGPLHKRRPRNTCCLCNSGWMSRLESASLPIVTPLIVGRPQLLDPSSQWTLAAMLSLISMRIELTAHEMTTIPQLEMESLRHRFMPTDKWRIWIARHTGTDLEDYSYRYIAMQASSEQITASGPEYCNTHVSTLTVGHLYAHVFFSTVWPDFPGYPGYPIVQIWPITGTYIDTRWLPPMSDEEGISMHEAISRGANCVERTSG